MLSSIICGLIAIVNLFTSTMPNWLMEIMAFAISFLPSSPFELETVEWGDFGKLIGYYIPIAKMLYHFTLMCGFMAMWYAVQHILRLVKTIK